MQLKDVRRVEWDEVTEAIEKCYELGWTDGLPVVPPTIERVQEFINYVGRSPDEVLGRIDERRREVTLAKAAANAVMAGCLPCSLADAAAHALSANRPRAQTPPRGVLDLVLLGQHNELRDSMGWPMRVRVLLTK